MSLILNFLQSRRIATFYACVKKSPSVKIVDSAGIFKKFPVKSLLKSSGKSGAETEFSCRQAKTPVDKLRAARTMNPMNARYVGQSGKEAGSNRFPLIIVAAVSGVLAILFFISATMDRRRIESVLYGMLERQGASQAERFGEYALYHYRQLVPGERDFHEFDPVMLPEAGTLTIRDQLVTDLVDLARDIDRLEASGQFDDKDLIGLARQWNVSGIWFFDDQGAPSGATRALPERAAEGARDLATGRSSVLVRLFDGPTIRGDGGFAGVARPDENGAVLVYLDGGDLRFWAWRTALSMAVQDFQWHRGVMYAGIYDEAGNIVAETGGAPIRFPGGDPRISRTPAEGHPGVWEYEFIRRNDRIEVIASPDIPEIPPTRAVLGLSAAEAAAILDESRRRIIFSTTLMLGVGLLAMAFLYGMQNRHIQKTRMMNEELNRARRLSSLGKLGAGMAHEIRNPLNSISMAAQRLAREYPVEGEKKAGYDRITEVIRLETNRLNKLVNDFLALTTSGRLRPRTCFPADVINRVVFLLGSEAGQRGVRLHGPEAGERREIRMDPDRMEQALINMIRNAFDATGEGGNVWVGMAYAKDFLVIRIRDDGEGIALEDQDAIFDPSYTTREKGVGLGLAIAHEIIDAHGGRIRLESDAGRGTTFEVVLPAGPR